VWTASGIWVPIVLSIALVGLGVMLGLIWSSYREKSDQIVWDFRVGEYPILCTSCGTRVGSSSHAENSGSGMCGACYAYHELLAAVSRP